MKFTIEIDREDDGRSIAEVPELSGVLCYGATQREAMAKAEALALRVIAEQLDHGEATVHFSPRQPDGTYGKHHLDKARR